MNDQIREYTADIAYVMVTKEFYDDAQEYKKADKRVAHFDEPLTPEPFYHNGLEVRLLAMRAHLLTALDFIEGRKGWVRDKDFIENDIVLRSSDNDFMDKVEELNPTIDFRLK